VTLSALIIIIIIIIIIVVVVVVVVVKTDPGAHPAFYLVRTGGSLPGSKSVEA